MNLFQKILDKLGFKQAAPAKPAPPASSGGPIPTGAIAMPKPAAIPVVDVVAKLEGLAAKNPQKLNWKVSIVDLLKLLDLESSVEARQGTGDRARLPRRQDGRFGGDEHLAPQDGIAEARRQRREHPEGTSGLIRRGTPQAPPRTERVPRTPGPAPGPDWARRGPRAGPDLSLCRPGLRISAVLGTNPPHGQCTIL